MLFIFLIHFYWSKSVFLFKKMERWKFEPIKWEMVFSKAIQFSTHHWKASPLQQFALWVLLILINEMSN